MKLLKIKKIIISLAIFILVLPIGANSAMQSDSYVIYETVMHSFDGPVISNVSHSINGITATITWSTNVIADSFVVYDTDSAVPDATSKEQGSSVKNSASHSVVMSGLEENTTYYYRVRSTRINGGITIDGTTRSFTTGTAPVDEEEQAQNSGGLLIIDKTDISAPIISNVDIRVLSISSVEVTWETDEEATSFVEYGRTASYGATYGHWMFSAEHKVVLENLSAGTHYNFRAISSDDWGNIAYSDNNIFTTSEGIIEEEEEEELIEEEEEDEGLTEEDFIQRARDFLRRLFPTVSLNEMGNDPFNDISALDDVISFMPVPVLSGEPRVEIGATEATIFWTTDVESTSQVALASEERFNPSASESYSQVIGDAENLTLEHEVRLYDLIPNMTYHYQLRSKASLGPMAYSRDFTFTTKTEELQITSFVSNIVDNQTVIFRWVTNKESNSAIKFAPYHGNILAIDEAKTIKDNAVSVIHEIEIAELEAGIYYDVELSSVDSKGNIANEIIEHFSTSEDDLPPIISQIKADSTIFLDSSNKTQTIISWLTNEPSTSRIYFQEGVHGSGVDLKESTNLSNDYAKEHVVVVTKFKPGEVYSFRVESIDSGGNATLSKTHTFMTAKKKESIIQIIMGILENTFGWMKKLM